MSEGQPPPEGPAPYTERDLDDLLSGNPANVPEALRQVATALDALRGGPTPDELDGEAAARAAFRMNAASAPADPVWAEVAQRPPAWYDSARDAMAGAELAPGEVAPPAPDWADVARQEPARLTQAAAPAAAGAGARLITRPKRPAGKRSRPMARHAAPTRAGWRAVTAVGTGAVALIVGVAALAGAFSGSGGQARQPGNSASADPSASVSSSSGPQVLGVGASKEPVTSPTPSANGAQSANGSSSAAERNELCRQYFEFFTHFASPGGRSAEDSIFKQLSELAGSPAGIVGYCVGDQSRGDSATSANPGTGSGNAGAGSANNGTGNNGTGNNGTGGNGNGTGGNGSGDNDGSGGQQKFPPAATGSVGQGSVGSIGSGLTGSGAHVGGSSASQLRSVQTMP